MYYCILTEYIDGVTLASYDEQHNLSYKEILTVGLWLLRVIKQLHAKGIAHNDISVDNIMVTHGKLKLIDFGLSCDTRAQRNNQCVGNRLVNMSYVAPEMLSGKIFTDPKKYSKTADIFAIGILLYELITMQKPYRYNDDYHITSPFIHIKGEPCLDNALHHMLYINPDTRANASQAYNLLYKCY